MFFEISTGLAPYLKDIKLVMAMEKGRKSVNTRKTTFIGGWNVRSCFRQAKHELIVKQLQKYRVQVAALSETAIYDSGILTTDDFTIIHSGASNDNKTRSAHGVAVCLNKQAAKVWKDSGSEWEAINDRIIMVRLGCKPINFIVLAVYAPINPSNGQKAQSAASVEFYKCLQAAMDKVSRRDMVLLMGDFNARVGLQQSQTA
ncbi:unnamed protein product, partial [Didymodactylos carnosus]